MRTNRAEVWFEKSKRYNEWTKNPEAMLDRPNPEAHDSRDLCMAYVGVDDVAQSVKLAFESKIVCY